MLTWTSVRRATYYNVQLFRDKKMMSTWPRTSLQLKRTWRFAGHRYKLAPGRYNWFVWPGLRRSLSRPLRPVIGSGTFVVMASS